MADENYFNNITRIASVAIVYACGRGSFPAEELGGLLHGVTVLLCGVVVGAAYRGMIDTWFLRKERRRDGSVEVNDA